MCITEAPKHPGAKIEEVQISSAVRRITLTNGDSLFVNTDGVIVDTVAMELTGTDLDGLPVQVPVGDIADVHGDSTGIVVFTSHSGRFDLKQRLVTGLEPDSTSAEIPLDEVCYIKGKVFNKRKARVQRTILISWLLGGILLAVSGAQVDWMGYN